MATSDPPSPEELNARYGDLSSQEVVTALCRDLFKGKVALLTAFGAESAILLDLVSRADPATPVIFLDTGKHFAETLAYRDLAIRRFRLTDLRQIRPDPEMLAAIDPDGTLWKASPNACCGLRKVVPLRQALRPFELVITGRKRLHGGGRETVELFERFDGRLRVNPLARWSQADLDHAMENAGLPRHPLVEQGFRSIGCRHCTRPISADEGARSGRWAGSEKSECGIHLPLALPQAEGSSDGR